MDLQLKPANVDDICVTPEAMKVTGIDLHEHLNDPQTITYEEGRVKLLALLTRNKIPRKRKHFRPCGQNVEFDINFCKQQLMPDEEWRKFIHHNTLDTLRILTFLQDCSILPKDLGRLESLVNYFNIPMGTAHNAKEDIRMTVDVYKALRSLLMGRKSTMSGAGANSLLEIIEE